MSVTESISEYDHPDEPTYAVTFGRYGGRYEARWALHSIEYQREHDECVILTVEGQPVDEWLALQKAK